VLPPIDYESLGQCATAFAATLGHRRGSDVLGVRADVCEFGVIGFSMGLIQGG
jgi:hypothetical protein